MKCNKIKNNRIECLSQILEECKKCYENLLKKKKVRDS